MRHLEVFIDGASKGNPGKAGVGVVICREGEVVKNISEYIGVATNNCAEYRAFIRALEEARSLGASELIVHTDSELLYRQINKLYKVRHENILDLYTQATGLIAGFDKVRLVHVSREQNTGADKLATLAVQKHVKACTKVASLRI